MFPVTSEFLKSIDSGHALSNGSLKRLPTFYTENSNLVFLLSKSCTYSKLLPSNIVAIAPDIAMASTGGKTEA